MLLPLLLLLTLGIAKAAPLEPIPSTEPHLHINPVEVGETIDISGFVPGDSFLGPDPPVTIFIDGSTFTATAIDGGFSVVLPSSFVQSLPEGEISIAASAADSAGNVVTGTSSVDNYHRISL